MYSISKSISYHQRKDSYPRVNRETHTQMQHSYCTRPVLKETTSARRQQTPLPVLNTAQHTFPLNKLKRFETKIAQKMWPAQLEVLCTRRGRFGGGVLTSIKPYKRTLTTSYNKNGLALSQQTTRAVINSYNIHNNKEHNGLLIHREIIIVRTYPVR